MYIKYLFQIHKLPNNNCPFTEINECWRIFINRLYDWQPSKCECIPDQTQQATYAEEADWLYI